jgi:carbonic anhydrase
MPLVGTLQSPIRINAAEAIEGIFPPDYFEIRYVNRASKVRVDGHNLAFDETPYQVITFDEAEWELRKIHIHSPAEHLLDSSDPHDFECHLIHFAKSDREMVGEKVVIGVFFRKKAEARTPASISKVSEAVGRSFAKGASGSTAADATLDINPRHFLPRAATQWFRYNGSLTSSPFSEDVNWFVMAKEIPIGADDTAELERYARQAARETFDRNRRIVLRNFPLKRAK